MAHQVRLIPSVSRDLKKLPRDAAISIRQRMGKLAEDPLPAGVEKVKDVKHCYRIRVGDYRIVYAVFNDTLVVLVVRVGHRSEVYKDIIPQLNNLIVEWEHNCRSEAE